jgi:hypothetical protein
MPSFSRLGCDFYDGDDLSGTVIEQGRNRCQFAARRDNATIFLVIISPVLASSTFLSRRLSNLEPVTLFYAPGPR